MSISEGLRTTRNLPSSDIETLFPHVGPPANPVGLFGSTLHIKSPGLLKACPNPIACTNSCAAIFETSAFDVLTSKIEAQTTVLIGCPVL